MKGRKTILLAALAALIPALSSCEKRIHGNPGGDGKNAAEKIFIIYSCGHNNLSSSLLVNINDICKTSPYCNYDSFYKVLVFNHRAQGSDYSRPVDPVLMQVYRNSRGEAVRDTLRIFPSKTYDENGTPSQEGYTGSDPETLREVLEYVKENYPAGEYGFLFSSHGTGWLPYNYYSTGKFSTKSAGADYSGNRTMGVPSEMDVKDFAQAIRDSGMHMKYILMDACFMGGIEVAYEVRDLCDYLMVSPAEIWSGGFMYRKMLSHLWGNAEPDLHTMCEDYLGMYSQATITLADCRKLERLAAECKVLFERYRSDMNAVDESEIQGFFRRAYNPEDEKHWFYDLRDIFIKSGISDAALADFDNALEQCVLYAGHTDTLFDGHYCLAYCGFSMYLPCVGNAELDGYYKQFQWNKDTGLVK